MAFRMLPNRRAEGPRPEYAIVVWAAFTVGYILFRNACGPAVGDAPLGKMWWLPPAAFGWLAWLHHRTGGRTSPTAALGFVAAGPVLGVCILVPWALTERRRFESAGVVDPVGVTEALLYLHTMGSVALLAACCVATIYAAATYQEWITAHIKLGTPTVAAAVNQHAPFFLAELGLDRGSTLSDLDRVYRDLARRFHPDHGGADADFKRLQATYELAHEYLAKRDERRAADREKTTCAEA